MFGIGPLELGVILVLALILLGPERLPEAARWAGRTMGEFRSFADDAMREVRAPLEELTQAVSLDADDLAAGRSKAGTPPVQDDGSDGSRPGPV